MHLDKHLRTKRAMQLALIVPALLTLAACGGFSADGVRPDPLPANVAAPCPHPLEVIGGVRGGTVGDDEVRMGRLGDALLQCGEEKAIAVTAYGDLRETLGGEM